MHTELCREGYSGRGDSDRHWAEGRWANCQYACEYQVTALA